MNVAAILAAKGRAVATASAETQLIDIVRKLGGKKIGAIVVTEAKGGVAGIISERDIIRVIAERGAEGLATPVGSVMTRQVITCREADTLDTLMSTMTTGRFRHMPVVEGGTLVGIVSIGDVVKHHIAEVEMEVSAMKGYLATG